MGDGDGTTRLHGYNNPHRERNWNHRQGKPGFAKYWATRLLAKDNCLTASGRRRAKRLAKAEHLNQFPDGCDEYGCDICDAKFGESTEAWCESGKKPRQSRCMDTRCDDCNAE